jgi:hypothetical protein
MAFYRDSFTFYCVGFEALTTVIMQYTAMYSVENESKFRRRMSPIFRDTDMKQVENKAPKLG